MREGLFRSRWRCPGSPPPSRSRSRSPDRRQRPGALSTTPPQESPSAPPGLRATAAIRSASSLAHLTDGVQRARASCRERLPSSLGLGSKLQSRELCYGAICGLYRDLNPERRNTGTGCSLIRLDASQFWRLRSDTNSSDRLLPFIVACNSTFAMARPKSFANPRCLQPGLG